LCPFMPMLKINRGYLRDVLNFGRGMAGLSFLTIIATQADVFVIGKLLSSKQVGMYALALSLAQQPVLLFARTIGRVLLPAFAEKQDDKKAICSAVVKIIRSILLLGVPLAVIATLGGKTILTVIYGAQYSVVAVPFALLCFAMLFYIQGYVSSSLYFAVGQPHLQRRSLMLLLFFILSLLYPGIKLFGLAGAAGVLLFSHSMVVFMQIIWMKDIIGLRFKDYVACWMPFIK
jgi:O-antigen/teichoic acid export membrane protein